MKMRGENNTNTIDIIPHSWQKERKKREKNEITERKIPIKLNVFNTP